MSVTDGPGPSGACARASARGARGAGAGTNASAPLVQRFERQPHTDAIDLTRNPKGYQTLLQTITPIHTAYAPNSPIVHITAVARNPWNPGEGRAPDPNGLDGQLIDLLHATNLNGNQTKIAIRNQFWADIDLIAAALQDFQAAGIPVIFRPFAEFNQINKYYWFGKNAAQFQDLWRDVYDRYVNHHGLHHLLFCWEVWVLNRSSGNGSADINPWYPGSAYVDVVAGSYYFDYQKTYLSSSTHVFRLPAYDADANVNDKPVHDILIGKDRPFGAAQWGLNQNDPNKNNPQVRWKGDNAFTQAFMDFCPDLAFAYYWDGYQSVELQYAANNAAFVNDSRVVTADDLPHYVATSSGSADGWLLESAAHSGVGGSSAGSSDSTSAFLITGDTSANKQYRSILSFDTSAIPSTAVIDSATLKIKRATAQNGGMGATTLKLDVKKGTFNAVGLESGSTGDFSTVGGTIGAQSNIVPPTVNGEVMSVVLNGTVRGLISKGAGAKTQFRLYYALDSDNNSNNNSISWYSGNAAIDHQPVLEVRYH